MRYLLLLLLSACIVELVTGDTAGVVYECAAPDGSVIEWCSILSADELSDDSGRFCMPTDRLWPRFTNAVSNGCVYSCEPHKGCNAKQGCYCPEGE